MSTTAAQGAAPVTVVEYYNATLDAYVMTGRLPEQAALDAVPRDFRRTGMQFSGVAASGAFATAGDVRICRFYVSVPGPASAFTSSHFYGREGIDCEALLAQLPSSFTYEGFDFTVANLLTTSPTAFPSACPDRAPVRVYRLFRSNANGRTSNHRYVTSSATYEAMLATGWSGEGVAFCVTTASDVAQAPEQGFQRVLTGAAPNVSPFSSTCSIAQSGTNYIGAEVEPYLALNPSNSQHLLAAWQQDRWANGGARGTASAVSFDGGSSWASSRAAFSQCGGGEYERATDPWVTIAPGGVAYQMALGFSGQESTPSSISAMLVARSADGGVTWGAPTTLIRDAGATFFNDKNMMVADPQDARYVYAVWGRLLTNGGGPAYFARTTNAGASWEAARSIYDPGSTNQTFGNQIIVLSDGSLLNFFTDIIRTATPASARGSYLRVIRSNDRGQSWSTPLTIALDLGVGVSDPVAGRVRDSRGLPSAAVSPTGEVFVVWQDARFSQGAHDGIALSSSKDGGATWSEPVRVNARGDVAAFGPTIAIRPDGTIGVSYFDLRAASAVGALTTTYQLATSSDGKYWRESGIESAFDITQAPFANGWFVGDYHGLIGHGTSFGALYAKVTGDPNNRTDIVFANLAEGTLKSVPPRYSATTAAGVAIESAWLREAALQAADRAARARLRRDEALPSSP
ncbi:MAG: exo-alpha-sialidase [Burkholderiales bacterium]|nr:exo-alpha-sialidase [Burkholderiales bacterium]